MSLLGGEEGEKDKPVIVINELVIGWINESKKDEWMNGQICKQEMTELQTA